MPTARAFVFLRNVLISVVPERRSLRRQAEQRSRQRKSRMLGGLRRRDLISGNITGRIPGQSLCCKERNHTTRWEALTRTLERGVLQVKLGRAAGGRVRIDSAANLAWLQWN